MLSYFTVVIIPKDWLFCPSLPDGETEAVRHRAGAPLLHHLYLHHLSQAFPFSFLFTMWIGTVRASAWASAPHRCQVAVPGLFSFQNHHHKLCLLMKIHRVEKSSLPRLPPHAVPNRAWGWGQKFVLQDISDMCCPKSEACPWRVNIRTGINPRALTKIKYGSRMK